MARLAIALRSATGEGLITARKLSEIPCVARRDKSIVPDSCKEVAGAI